MKTVKVTVKREQLEGKLSWYKTVHCNGEKDLYIIPDSLTLELPLEQIHVERGPLNYEQMKSLRMTYDYLADMIKNESFRPEDRIRASICFEHFPGPSRIEMLGGQQKPDPATCAHDFEEIEMGGMGIKRCRICGTASKPEWKKCTT